MIVINPDNLLVVLAGFQIKDFPSTGEVLNITEGQASATYIPSFGQDALILGPEWYTVMVTVQAGSPSDNYFEAARRAQRTTRKVLEFSASRGGQPLFGSVTMGITTMPPVVKSADGFPTRAWGLSGKAVGPVTAGLFVASTALTQEEIQNA
jgi:hypothetical protein